MNIWAKKKLLNPSEHCYAVFVSTIFSVENNKVCVAISMESSGRGISHELSEEGR